MPASFLAGDRVAFNPLPIADEMDYRLGASLIGPVRQFMYLLRFLVWGIAALVAAGLVVRPFRVPEAVWAVAGAILVVAFGLLPASEAVAAVARGNDVYLFLAGMMLLSEAARREGLFAWIAVHAARTARGSAPRLFLLLYGAGVVVTAVLSNDATAVVMTPAVFAVARAARVDPLPFLFICAFVANAASFVLPMSNPANLVVYDGHMPALAAWLARLLIPSLLAIVATYFVLWWVQRTRIGQSCAAEIAPSPLTAGGKTALVGIVAAAAALLGISALNIPLGLPTAVVGATTALVICLRDRKPPWPMVKEVTWSIIPLVAGLFVLVGAVAHTGAIAELASRLNSVEPRELAVIAGGAIAVVSNAVNNLPAGLLASATLAEAHAPRGVVDSVLMGVDLGPNLSITGSLATILWLAAIRREGAHVSFWQFFRIGILAMPAALVLALGARLLLG